MMSHRPPSRSSDCKVCLVQHDEDLHQATLSVRQWFHSEVVRRLEDYSDAEVTEIRTEPARVA